MQSAFLVTHSAIAVMANTAIAVITDGMYFIRHPPSCYFGIVAVVAVSGTKETEEKPGLVLHSMAK